MEAEARDFRARGLAGLEQRVLRRDVDLVSVDDELGHLIVPTYRVRRFKAVARCHSAIAGNRVNTG